MQAALMSRVVRRFFMHLYLTIGTRKSTLSNMDTETQPTKPGPCEVYYDDGTSRYYIASGAAWASLQSGKYESYSMWCSTCAGSDLGDSDGYDDQDDAITDAARLDAA